jgi:hypothetical protein
VSAACDDEHELLMLLWMQMTMASCCVHGDEHGARDVAAATDDDGELLCPQRPRRA